MKSTLFCFFSCLLYLGVIITTLLSNKFHPVRTTYCLIIGVLLEYVLYKDSYFCRFNLYAVKPLRIIIFLCIYTNLVFSLMFPIMAIDPNNPNNIRLLYFFVINMNLLYMYYLDYNLLMLVVFPLLNSIIIISVQYTMNFTQY